MSTATAEELLGWLRCVFEKEFEIPQAEVSPAARLVDDLALDSLDAVIVSLRIEDELGLELAEDELAGIDTVAALVALVQQRLQGASVAS